MKRGRKPKNILIADEAGEMAERLTAEKIVTLSAEARPFKINRAMALIYDEVDAIPAAADLDSDEFKADLIPRTGRPCHHCGGSGNIEVPNEDGDGFTEETCAWCNGTGIEAASKDLAYTAEDVTAEMLSEICGEIGYTPKAWGFIQPESIVAASANVLFRHLNN